MRVKLPPCVYLKHFCSSYSSLQQNDFGKLISNLEQTIGYNSSLLSLRSLFNDEIFSLAINLTQVLDGKHPLLKNIKKLIHEDNNIVQMYGVSILLLSKIFGIPVDFSATHIECQQGISLRQRSLAEVVQIMYLAKMIHRGIVEFVETPEKSLIVGNNLTILSGDYLLACASRDLAKLSSPKVVEIMSQALADMMQTEFLSQEHSNLNYKHLLGYGAMSSLILVNHSIPNQKLACQIGDNIGKALDLHSDIKDKPDNTEFSCILKNKNKYIDNTLQLLSKVSFGEEQATLTLKQLISSFATKPP